MKSPLINSYYHILSSLKEKIYSARQRTVFYANVQLLQMYWEIGQTIAIQEKKEGWGSKVVETLSKDLLSEFPDMKGLSVRNLRYMRDFALAYPKFELSAKNGKNANNAILQPVAAKLTLQEEIALLAAEITWAHNIVLLTKLKTLNHRIFYAKKTIQNGWSRRVLEIQINNKLHLRTGKAISNFERTLPPIQSDLAKESFKNPYLFDFLGIGEEMQERELEKALVTHLKKFMLELGKGFAYVGDQEKLTVAGDDYFLDLLFFNFHLNCFVVFELKIGEFMPEYVGKLNFYINTVDEKIKRIQHNPTIGILLCKTPNKTVVEYALRGLAKPLGVADYELSKALPKKLKSDLPTIDELEMYMQPDFFKKYKRK